MSAEESMINNLKKNTGKSLEQWVQIVQKTSLKKHGEMIKFLKSEHGFTHGFANLVAHKARKSDAGSVSNTDDLVEGQFKGKEHFRKLYDSLTAFLEGLGNDIELAPKKAYVSVRRKKQFAILNPATKTRFEIQLNLKGEEESGNLKAITKSSAMCSHVINKSKEDDLNDEDKDWLAKAYDLSA